MQHRTAFQFPLHICDCIRPPGATIHSRTTRRHPTLGASHQGSREDNCLPTASAMAKLTRRNTKNQRRSSWVRADCNIREEERCTYTSGNSDRILGSYLFSEWLGSPLATLWSRVRSSYITLGIGEGIFPRSTRISDTALAHTGMGLTSP
jgi:hypothetical protein